MTFLLFACKLPLYERKKRKKEKTQIPPIEPPSNDSESQRFLRRKSSELAFASEYLRKKYILTKKKIYIKYLYLL